VPALAEAIVVLAARGDVKLFFGEPRGKVRRVLPPDVRDIVMDPSNWWSPIDGTTPETALELTPQASPVSPPQRRPEMTSG